MIDTKKIPSQEEVNSVAWKACDTFRGVVDPDQYKNYILVFLFIKYISDLWKDKVEEYSLKYKGDEERIERALKRERFVVPKQSTFDYLYSHRNDVNIGELINIATANLEEENSGKLEDVFRGIDFNSEINLGETKDRNTRLKNLIEDFAKPELDFRPSHIGERDVIGDTYEYLLYMFASGAGKKGGEFYTPQFVSKLLARLLKPKEGNRIYDPTCGSGSLLIKVANEVGSANYSIYGQESNGNTYALCKMNMFLHKIDNAKIAWGNTISNPKHVEADKLMKFDIVVANPPFSLDKWGADDAPTDKFNRFWRGIPPKSKGDYAFITHMIESMNETARVGVIVPHGVLFRGSSEGRIREQFINDNLLEAVIGLPANLFFGTGIPAAILIFNKRKKNTDVIFVDASKEYESGTNQNKLRDSDIDKIVSTYEKFETVDKYSYKATIDEIKENEYNLNIPRYVDTFEEEEEVDIAKVQEEIVELEKQLSDVRSQMNKYLEELGYKS
ncbi:MAG: type I restriction-modification system subunit M [Ignavibacteria bacterium]|nr:type I restriction-modification system subunit M [Ignavibacteria bacterium]